MVGAYLLDVNLLLALIDTLHVHHSAAHRWFAARARTAWATCPVTENGFVRIVSQPRYPNRTDDAAIALDHLRRWCATGGHEFWPDEISLRDVVQPGTALTHNQLTDVYLLALAAHRGGKFATFDGRIPVTAVAGGAQALEVIPV